MICKNSFGTTDCWFLRRFSTSRYVVQYIHLFFDWLRLVTFEIVPAICPTFTLENFKKSAPLFKDYTPATYMLHVVGHRPFSCHHERAQGWETITFSYVAVLSLSVAHSRRDTVSPSCAGWPTDRPTDLVTPPRPPLSTTAIAIIIIVKYSIVYCTSMNACLYHMRMDS